VNRRHQARLNPNEGTRRDVLCASIFEHFTAAFEGVRKAGATWAFILHMKPDYTQIVKPLTSTV
jgi:hypothetical protein